MAKYFIYIGGTCEVPCNYFSGVILPWIVAAIINHLEIYDYLVNWTAIICSLYVQFVCPMFMWSKSVKEAQIYENNFKQSMQMILDKNVESEVEEKSRARQDGVPSIDNSIKIRGKGINSSKFLQGADEEEEIDKLSNITEVFYDEDEKKFIKVYNQ